MRINSFIVLMLVLVFSSLGFSQYTFGPGDVANDCSNPALGTSSFAASGIYTWAGGATMSYDNTTGSGPNGFNCIDVLASDVVIDCNDNTIDGSSGNGDIGIFIAFGVDNVTIRNCVIEEFGWGASGGAGHRLAVGNVFIDGATNIVLDSTNLTYIFSSPGQGDHITYSYNVTRPPTSGLTLNNSHLLTFMPPVPGSNAAGIAGRMSDGTQVSAQVDNVIIEDSSSEQQPTYGAWIDGDDVQVYGSVFEWNTDYGLYLNGNDNYVYGNTFNNNMQTGLVISSSQNSQVLSNDMIGNSYYGAAFVNADDVYFYDNNASNNVNAGIILEQVDNVTVEGCEMGGNSDEGIWVESSGMANNDVHLLSNIIYDNNYGISMENCMDSEIDGNTIWNIVNAGIRLESVDPTTVSNNDVSDADSGIYACDVQYVTFDSNELHANDNEGLYLGTGCFAEATNEYITIENNDIYGNGAQGIYAENTDYISMTNNQIYMQLSDDGAQLYNCYAPEIYLDNNFSLNGDSGLYLNFGTDNALVYDNTFIDNDYGFRMDASNDLYLYDNVFYDNNGIAGVFIRDSDIVRIYNNDFQRNNDAIYADPTSNINITGNVINDSSNDGIYFDDITTSYIYDNYIGYAAINGLEFNFIDSVDIVENDFEEAGQDCLYIENAADTNIIDNTIANCGSDGIYLDGAEYTTVDPNYIHGCADTGIYATGGSNYLTVDGNFIYENNRGIFIGDNYATVTNNEIHDNLGLGIDVTSATDGDFNNNLIYNNGYSGYYIYQGSSHTFTDEVLYGNGYDCLSDWDPECYGIYLSESDDAVFDNVVSRDSWGGMWIDVATSPTLTDVSVYGNTEDSLYVDDASNFVFTRVNLYNNGGYGYYFDTGSQGTMTDCSVHDNGPGVYGIEVYNGCDIVAVDLDIYSQTDSWLLVEFGSTFDTTGLRIGYDELYGAEWPATTIFDAGISTDIYDSNFLIGPDFISMDDSSVYTDELNVGGVSLRTQVSGCSGIQYYHADDFPADSDEIIATGASFSPLVASCTGSVASYSADLNFSGYTAQGTLSFGSGGSSSSDKRMTVSSEILCPGDEVEFTVTYSGSPVEGVEVELTQYNPYAGIIATGTTNSAGRVTFGLPVSGVYRAYLDKVGYTYSNPYVFDHTVCSGEEAGECRTDSACAGNQACVDGSCVSLTGECGYASAHTWIDYECCEESDCAAEASCVSHVCVNPEEEIAEETPDEVVNATGPSDDAALAALDEATGAIWEASQRGLDVTAAREKFKEAQDAYNAGHYDDALDLAKEATRLANEAAAPAGTDAESGTEEPSDGSGNPASPVGIQFDLMLILLGIVILGGLGGGAYWLLNQAKPKGGYKPKSS